MNETWGSYGNDEVSEVIRRVSRQVSANVKRKVSRAEAIRSQLRQLQDELAYVEKFPADDPLEDGEALQVSLRYSPNGRSYTFVMLRIDGRYYATTGARSRVSVSWQDFVDELSETYDVRMVKLEEGEVIVGGNAADDVDS